MPDLTRLPTWDEDGRVRVVVESPRGTNVKIAYDPGLQVFALRRALVSGVAYPFDWGFVPSTEASDGDPLDAMVIHDGATYPGVVIACRLLGLVKVTQRAALDRRRGARERNDRVIAVPAHAARAAHLRGIRDLDTRTRDELEQFFKTATLFEEKDVKVVGWGGARDARMAIEKARGRARTTG